MDIYLALAGFFQILLIGVLGTVVSNFIEPKVNKVNNTLLYLASVTLVALVALFYTKAFHLVKNNKKKKP